MIVVLCITSFDEVLLQPGLHSWTFATMSSDSISVVGRGRFAKVRAHAGYIRICWGV